MTTAKTRFVTPVGRWLMGDPFTPQTTDKEGRPLVYKSGSQIGQPRVNYYLGIAIAKNDPGWDAFYSELYNEARKLWPNLFDPQGNCLNPDFAFKVKDGDSTAISNDAGVRFCDRANFPGHWIVSLSNGFAPSMYVSENGQWSQITDQTMLKRGYYVQISGDFNSNNSTSKPGIFLNMDKILLVAHGQEIFTGTSVEQDFAGVVATVPLAASPIPLASNMPPPAQAATPSPAPMPEAPAQAATPSPAPMPAQQGPTPGQTPTAPAMDFVDPDLVQVNVNGQVTTVGALKVAKWNDEQIASLPRV